MKEEINEKVHVFNLTPFVQRRVSKWIAEKFDMEEQPRVKGKYKSAERAIEAYRKATRDLPDGSLVLVGGSVFIQYLASRDRRFTVCIPHVEHGCIIDMSVMKNGDDSNTTDKEGL